MLLAGCGAADPPRQEDPLVVAALGDSITAGNPLFDPDPASGFGSDERSQYEYWAERELDGYEFRNCGVFGERTDEIAARLGDCAEGADLLIVQGGINDIAQGRPVEDAAADLREMVAAGKAAGLDVLVADVLPWNNGHPQADAPIARLNREIAAIARREGVRLLRFHEELEDPEEPWTMGPGLTDDGDHPSVEGHRRLGLLVADRIEAG